MITSTDQHAIIRILRGFPLFQNCPDNFIEQVSAQAVVNHVDKGHVLFVHEDEAARFFIISQGWVKLFRETLDGAQAVVDILTTGHMLGETAIFQNDAYPYSAEAVESTEIISLPLSLLKKEIESNPKLALDMLSVMARYRRQQDQELEHRSIQNAPQRIGCFLLRLTNQNENSEGPITIHLPYDKTLIASRLGMQPETFSRALTKLKNATGINVNGATVTMDSLDQLVEYSCAACSSEFPCKDIQSTSCSSCSSCA